MLCSYLPELSHELRPGDEDDPTIRNRVRRVGPLTVEVTTASAERPAFAAGHHVVATFKGTATRLVA